jgi:hypothetical protein
VVSPVERRVPQAVAGAERGPRECSGLRSAGDRESQEWVLRAPCGLMQRLAPSHNRCQHSQAVPHHHRSALSKLTRCTKAGALLSSPSPRSLLSSASSAAAAAGLLLLSPCLGRKASQSSRSPVEQRTGSLRSRCGGLQAFALSGTGRKARALTDGEVCCWLAALTSRKKMDLRAPAGVVVGGQSDQSGSRQRVLKLRQVDDGVQGASNLRLLRMDTSGCGKRRRDGGVRWVEGRLGGLVSRGGAGKGSNRQAARAPR